MAKKSGRFKKDKLGIPDPLHFDFPQHHKKLFELIYILCVVGALLSVILLYLVGILTVEQRNASVMIIFLLSIMLALMIIERSLITHPGKAARAKPAAQRPKSSSS